MHKLKNFKRNEASKKTGAQHSAKQKLMHLTTLSHSKHAKTSAKTNQKAKRATNTQHLSGC
jgi:hypothetical protein